ncbi:hypothetical protein EZS27_026082 [termite gut metagenome]|uniref:Uncharacterized protein n=1 Tax=termite gut metagenome TaxID=433724 RepID=A0A5J4QU26_9ZZZZ
MAKFIELHKLDGDNIFVRAEDVAYFLSHTCEDEGIPCTLVKIDPLLSPAIKVKETPAEILDKIREPEYTEALNAEIAKSVEALRYAVKTFGSGILKKL